MRAQGLVVVVSPAQGHHPGLLQRRGGAHGEEVVHLADGVGEVAAARAPSPRASR